MTPHSSQRALCIVYVFACACAALLLAGCGDEELATYPVQGRVTFRGEPVPTGSVMFIPAQGPAAATTIAPDGSYELQAVAGRHTVTVVAQQRWPAGFDPASAARDWVPPPPLVPAKYNRPATSGLVVEVQAVETNEANLVLAP